MKNLKFESGIIIFYERLMFVSKEAIFGVSVHFKIYK